MTPLFNVVKVFYRYVHEHILHICISLVLSNSLHIRHRFHKNFKLFKSSVQISDLFLSSEFETPSSRSKDKVKRPSPEMACYAGALYFSKYSMKDNSIQSSYWSYVWQQCAITFFSDFQSYGDIGDQTGRKSFVRFIYTAKRFWPFQLGTFSARGKHGVEELSSNK